MLAGALAALLTPALTGAPPTSASHRAAAATRTPQVYAAVWPGLVVAVAVPVLAALSAMSLDLTATLQGSVLPVVRLGSDPLETAWRATLLAALPAGLLAASGAAIAGRVRVLVARRPVRRV
ncbi:hypothetical protein [Microbispora sp. NPDC046933]|uniref:hypothetical protein n=1 Tax=Microbispora sp. NPDC046933 TaxID=3155618 RepID=UPI0033DB4B4B